MAVALTIVKPVRVYSTPSFREGMRDLGGEGAGRGTPPTGGPEAVPPEKFSKYKLNICNFEAVYGAVAVVILCNYTGAGNR